MPCSHLSLEGIVKYSNGKPFLIFKCDILVIFMNFSIIKVIHEHCAKIRSLAKKKMKILFENIL
jgi:hypothetical protein